MISEKGGATGGATSDADLEAEATLQRLSELWPLLSQASRKKVALRLSRLLKPLKPDEKQASVDTTSSSGVRSRC